MTYPYTATIEEKPREITGMDADGKYLLAGGEELWIKPLKISTRARARRLKRVSKLTFTGGEWLLDGENLKCRYFDATTKSHESSGEARSEAHTTFRLREVLNGVSDEDRPEINGLAWFDEGFDAIEGETAEMCAVTNDDLDALAGVGSHVKRRPLPPAKEFMPVLLTDYQISSRHGQDVKSYETAVQMITSERKRIEAISDQLGARTTALKEAIAPLANLYSEGDLAEIRKRAVGKEVPADFVDWVMTQFQHRIRRSCQPRGRPSIIVAPTR
jgi:hypothetical protein